MIKRATTLSILIFSIALAPALPAHGQIVSTQAAMQLELRQNQVDRINAVLARSEVKEALRRHGVDAHAAAERIDALNDMELAELAAKMESLPAGGVGVVEVVGVVAVVLIVLELLGVTDVFTAI